jgi:hypothetical protein
VERLSYDRIRRRFRRCPAAPIAVAKCAIFRMATVYLAPDLRHDRHVAGLMGREVYLSNAATPPSSRYSASTSASLKARVYMLSSSHNPT